MNRNPLRIPRRGVFVVVLLCLTLTLVAASGCRHASRRGATSAPPALEPVGLRGERVLVVATTPEAAAVAAEVVRHLSALPIRATRPGEFGEEVAPAVGGEADVEAWQAWAWERRIPYLLTLAVAPQEAAAAQPGSPVVSRAALVPAREGDAVWTVEQPSAMRRAVPVDLRGKLREDLGVPPERPDGHPTSWITVPADDLAALDAMVLMEPDATAADRVARARQDYPLDPATIELEAALLALQEAGDGGAVLARQAQVHRPEGTSRLPLLARGAGRAGMEPQAELLWQLTVQTWPGRVDYALEYADLLGEREDHDRASAVLLDAASRLMPEDVVIPEDLVSRPDRAVELARLARLGDLRYLQGWHLFSTGEHDAALAAYDAAVDYYQAVEEPASVASCHNNIGVTLIDAGRPLPALSYLKRALLARGGAGSSMEQANTLYNLGSAYEASGRLLEARDALAQATGQYDDIEAFEDAYDTRLDLVVLEGEIGTSSSVEQAFSEALETTTGHEDELELRARALGAVGVARARVDHFEESLVALEEALATWVDLGDRLRQGQTLYSLAITYLGQGEHDRAIESLTEARVIADELGDIESMVAIDFQIEQIDSLR